MKLFDLLKSKKVLADQWFAVDLREIDPLKNLEIAQNEWANDKTYYWGNVNANFFYSPENFIIFSHKGGDEAACSIIFWNIYKNIQHLNHDAFINIFSEPNPYFIAHKGDKIPEGLTPIKHCEKELGGYRGHSLIREGYVIIEIEELVDENGLLKYPIVREYENSSRYLLTRSPNWGIDGTIWVEDEELKKFNIGKVSTRHVFL